ncbi:MAG: dissimilatory sulfite reductase D family protein, partial [Proteobacteria bacterium]|nr:dissimilatory sulfite reductase D family protein [Pseudomonadota bacterium]
DMEKGVRKVLPDVKARAVKKAATELINEEKLIYFSTGSSTMYGLKGRGQTEDH